LKFIKTKLQGLYIIQPEPFKDNRGTFSRVFCERELKEIHFGKKIVQINQSFTKREGSIRGMHFQYPPNGEIKLVRCIAGRIFDVAVDLRNKSPTFLEWHSEVLSANNMKIMYIPEGFAHGFQTLQDDCDIVYFVSAFYSPESEGGIRYNDPKIKIEWPIKITEISEKDRNYPLIDQNFEGISL